MVNRINNGNTKNHKNWTIVNLMKEGAAPGGGALSKDKKLHRKIKAINDAATERLF